MSKFVGESRLADILGWIKTWSEGAFAAITHSHAATDVTSGTLPVERGGTGQSSLATARASLGSIPTAHADQDESSSGAKTAVLDGFSLFAGCRVSVEFDYANTGNDALTLDVNGTGAKDVYSRGLPTSSSNLVVWAAGDVLDFFYDGTVWHCLGDPFEEKLPADAFYNGYTWGAAKQHFTWGTLKGSPSTENQTYTPALGLAKPGYGDVLDVAVLNSNMDILDETMRRAYEPPIPMAIGCFDEKSAKTAEVVSYSYSLTSVTDLSSTFLTDTMFYKSDGQGGYYPVTQGHYVRQLYDYENGQDIPLWYVLTSDSVVDGNKTYYEYKLVDSGMFVMYQMVQVEEPVSDDIGGYYEDITTGFNPSQNGWYENSGGSFMLSAGARVSVKFVFENTYQNSFATTLNVNGTGAKDIYAGGYEAGYDVLHWSSGSVCDFLYDGSHWVYMGSDTSWNLLPGSGVVKSSTAPHDTSPLWLDTSIGVLKYYDTTTSAWVAVKSVWG